MIKDPVKTSFLRLFCVFLILFAILVAMGSVPIRSQSVNMSRVIFSSLGTILIGPVFPLFIINKIVGIFGAFVFWFTFLNAALGSREKRSRRWFYILLTIFILMTSFTIFLEIAMGLIAMAHA